MKLETFSNPASKILGSKTKMHTIMEALKFTLGFFLRDQEIGNLSSKHLRLQIFLDFHLRKKNLQK